jgi:hypothetical protein
MEKPSGPTCQLEQEFITQLLNDIQSHSEIYLILVERFTWSRTMVHNISKSLSEKGFSKEGNNIFNFQQSNHLILRMQFV